MQFWLGSIAHTRSKRPYAYYVRIWRWFCYYRQNFSHHKTHLHNTFFQWYHKYKRKKLQKQGKNNNETWNTTNPDNTSRSRASTNSIIGSIKSPTHQKRRHLQTLGNDSTLNRITMCHCSCCNRIQNLLPKKRKSNFTSSGNTSKSFK